MEGDHKFKFKQQDGTYLEGTIYQSSSTPLSNKPNTKEHFKERSVEFVSNSMHIYFLILCIIFGLISLTTSILIAKSNTTLIFYLYTPPSIALFVFLITLILFVCKKERYGAMVFLSCWVLTFATYLFIIVALCLYLSQQYSHRHLSKIENPIEALIIILIFTISLVVYSLTTWPLFQLYVENEEEEEDRDFWSCKNPCILGLFFFSLTVFLILTCLIGGWRNSCTTWGNRAYERRRRRFKEEMRRNEEAENSV